MRRAFVLGSLLAASFSGGALAADAPSGEDMGASISAVQAPARMVDRMMAYCTTKFPGDPGAALAARRWHERNGQWEAAASELRAETLRQYVKTGAAANASAFDHELDGIMDEQVDRMVAKFDAMPADTDRASGCQRLTSAIDAGKLDAEAAFPQAMPLLRKYLKK